MLCPANITEDVVYSYPFFFTEDFKTYDFNIIRIFAKIYTTHYLLGTAMSVFTCIIWKFTRSQLLFGFRRDFTLLFLILFYNCFMTFLFSYMPPSSPEFCLVFRRLVWYSLLRIRCSDDILVRKTFGLRYWAVFSGHEVILWEMIPMSSTNVFGNVDIQDLIDMCLEDHSRENVVWNNWSIGRKHLIKYPEILSCHFKVISFRQRRIMNE